MKNSIIIFCLLISSFALAQKDGSEGGGGGDACENRIKEIAKDIGKWINLGGSKSLHFTKGMNFNIYNKKMLELIEPINKKTWSSSRSARFFRFEIAVLFQCAFKLRLMRVEELISQGITRTVSRILNAK